MDDDPINEMRAVGMTAAAAVSRTAETIIRNMQERARQQRARAQQTAEEAATRVRAQATIAENHFRAATADGWLNKATPAEQGQTWLAAQRWQQIDQERFGPYAADLEQRLSARYGSELLSTVRELDGDELGADLIELSARRRVEAEQEREREQEDRSRGDAVSVPQQSGEAERPSAGLGGDREADMHRDRAESLESEADALDGQSRSAERGGYDTKSRRELDEKEMVGHGVPPAASHAKMTADHGNGADPRKAATNGSRQRTSKGKGNYGRQRTPSRGR